MTSGVALCYSWRMKDFQDSDVQAHGAGAGSIICLKSELIRKELQWMKRGLQETATGYGARLNSGLMIRFKGREAVGLRPRVGRFLWMPVSFTSTVVS